MFLGCFHPLSKTRIFRCPAAVLFSRWKDWKAVLDFDFPFLGQKTKKQFAFYPFGIDHASSFFFWKQCLNEDCSFGRVFFKIFSKMKTSKVKRKPSHFVPEQTSSDDYFFNEVSFKKQNFVCRNFLSLSKKVVFNFNKPTSTFIKIISFRNKKGEKKKKKIKD